jgi:alkylation response protein AidB-like acyl-CoA dehydrogenase
MSGAIASDELREMRATVRAFLGRYADEAAVRSQMLTVSGFDPAAWRQFADQLGATGILIPETLDGAGLSFRELAVVLEELGSSVAGLPFLSAAVAAPLALLHCGTPEAQADYLPRIAAGARAALAASESDADWPASPQQTRAAPEDGHWRVTGRKVFVLDGHTAELLLVTAETDAGPSLFAVEDFAGVRRWREAALDQTRPIASIDFDSARARLVSVDGGVKDGLARTRELIDLALVAESIGLGTRVLEMAVNYAKTRFQFGRPIGSFQVIKHRCAEMLLTLELAKSVYGYALDCVDANSAELPLAAAMAKAYCVDAAYELTRHNIQIHGGIGVTWEHPAHLYFKRAKVNQLLFGDSARQREAVAAALGI